MPILRLRRLWCLFRSCAALGSTSGNWNRRVALKYKNKLPGGGYGVMAVGGLWAYFAGRFTTFSGRSLCITFRPT